MARRAKKSAYFTLKTPDITPGARTGKRNSFALFRQIKDDTGKMKTTKVEEPRIDIITRRYLSGEASYEESLKQAEEIKEEYNARTEVKPAVNIHNADNLRIFQSIWEDDYQYRDIDSARSRMIEFARIFELLGHESIISISIPDFQHKINKHCGDDANRQRRMATTANQLLKFVFSRGFATPSSKLKMKKKKRDDIPHLSIEDFEKVMAEVESVPHRNLYKGLFSSGERLGEMIFCSSDKVSVKADGTAIATVDGQIVKAEQEYKSESAPTQYRSEMRERDRLKNQTVRRMAFVFEYGVEALQQWAALPQEKKIEIRRGRYLEPFQDACKKVFPDQQKKWIDTRGIRHSYAIHLLRLGMSLEDVARSIGDTMKVCEEYYAGFSHTPESVKSMADRYRELVKKVPGEAKEQN